MKNKFFDVTLRPLLRVRLRVLAKGKKRAIEQAEADMMDMAYGGIWKTDFIRDISNHTRS